jgi:uncharacterized membrane protein
MDSAETLAAQYLSRDRSIDIGGCISRAIDIVTANLGLMVGAFVLALVVMLGIALVPILGWIAAFFVDPVIIAGLYLVVLKRIRGQEATVGDIFNPFGGSVINLALAGIVSGILVAVGLFLFVVPGIYLAVCYIFALTLVADKQLEFWTAMELSRRVVHRHWFSMFLLLIVAAVLSMLGLIAVLVGVLLTAPIGLAAIAGAYEDLFGEAPTTAAVTV